MLIYQDILTSPRLRYFCVLTQRKRQIATVSIRYGVFFRHFYILQFTYKTDSIAYNIIKAPAPKSPGRAIISLYHF